MRVALNLLESVIIRHSGVNMYAMLTGRLPFASNNVTTLHTLIMEHRYQVPEGLSDGLYFAM